MTQTPLQNNPDSSSLKIYSFHSTNAELIRSVELPSPSSPGFEFLKVNPLNDDYRLVTSAERSLELVPLPREVIRFISKKAAVLGTRREAKSEIVCTS